MKYRSVFAWGVIGALSLLSGCATVTTGTSQSIAVVTEKDVTEAKCELTDSKGGKWYVSETPASVTVRKGDGPMSVVCKKDGFKTSSLMIDETFVGATLGNVILGGGVGIFVDIVSGAAQEYPDTIRVWMEPEEWAAEDDRLAWMREKEAYEQELEAAKNAALETENQE